MAEGTSAAATEGQPGRVARIAAVAAVLIAIGVVAYLLFAAGSDYRVTGKFASASQLVEGNEVRIGGVPVGSVTDLDIGPNGVAEVEMEIDDEHSPLDRGTRAVIRLQSLSGIANRFVDLQLPRGDTGSEIPDGGTIEGDDAQAAVDVDQLFETLDEPTRDDLQTVLRGFAEQIEGKEAELNAGYRFLSPALSTSRRLFQELTADTVLLERFVVDSAKLVTTLADRRDDLAALVGNLNDTTRAAGAEKEALVEAIGLFPDFMRRANTTFANLRGTLDEVDPLVDASKPVARKLQDFLPELRSFAEDAEPTVRDLSRTIRRRGRGNDLVELFRTFPPLADVAVETKRRNGRRRPGAFPETERALRDAAPLIAFGRPYTPDFFGWADDFSHTGLYDAIGGFSRSQIFFNLFSVSAEGVPTLLTLQERPANFLEVAETGQVKRCPGGAEPRAPDGSNVLTEQQRQALDCEEDDRAAGRGVAP